MRDPYEVLGLQRGASDDEVKKAYRTLSRRYHPDANVNNPNKAQAEERFKEVQQAYDAIQHEKDSGGYGYGPGSRAGGAYGGFGSYGGFNGGFGSYGGYQGAGARSQSESDIRMQAAANYINSRHFNEALNVLGQISDRDARWYYLSAIANSGVGNNAVARQMAQTASDMEPDNIQYRQLLQRLEGGGDWYQGMGASYGMPMESGTDICSQLCLANLLCSVCGPGAFCCI